MSTEAILTRKGELRGSWQVRFTAIIYSNFPETSALTMKHLDELHIGYFAAFWNQPIIRVVRSIRGKKCDIIILCCTRVCVFWEEGGPGAGSRADMPPFCGNYWPGGGSHKAVLGSYSNTELFTGGGYGAIKIIRARAEMMAVSDRQMKCYQNRIMML